MVCFCLKVCRDIQSNSRLQREILVHTSQYTINTSTSSAGTSLLGCLLHGIAKSFPIVNGYSFVLVLIPTFVVAFSVCLCFCLDCVVESITNELRVVGILESSDGRSARVCLCLKLLSKFTNHLHETYYTLSL